MHIPILRHGKPYKSLATVDVKDFRTGKTVAQLSQANSGLIRKDSLLFSRNKAALDALPVKELLTICKNAAALFLEETLPIGDEEQSPEAYINFLTATTGMPATLGRKNMEKIHHVLNNMEGVLGGLTRGLDLSILDAGWGDQYGRTLSYLVQTHSLGAILPNNSPGVHSLWLPAIPLKVPLAVKPGTQEPWTPFRIIQAFIAAGCPEEAFGFYPTDHSGASQILMNSGRSMLFGDASTVKAWEKDRRVQVHGPGWSKVILGPDQADDWELSLDTIVDSIAINSGRSCLNASGVWTTGNGRKIAEALAERLSKIEARAMEDPKACLAAFVNPEIAKRTSQLIDQGLAQGGAIDLTAKHRSGERVVEVDGATFILPTIIWCDSKDHPLASAELLFPFASVVETDETSLFDEIGYTLVGTVISKDRNFLQKAMTTQNIDRLNIGSLPTSIISWDQPHEGNLFEHLYHQRAFQKSV